MQKKNSQSIVYFTQILLAMEHLKLQPPGNHMLFFAHPVFCKMHAVLFSNHKKVYSLFQKLSKNISWGH